MSRPFAPVTAPPLASQAGETFPRLVELMQRLLAPDGCPWDREQTLDSLKPFLVEETYEVLDALDHVDVETAESYEHLEEAGARLEAGLTDAATAAGASVQVSRVGSLLTAFVDGFPTFFHAMLAAGIMLPPSQHEAWFVSTAHRDADLDATLLAARDALAVAGKER